MNEAFRFILLGILQGLTEFLPVSSSGHLVVFQKLLGIEEGVMATTVALHLGTVFALLVYFYKDIRAALKDINLIKNILLITFITGIIGIGGHGFIKRLFGSLEGVSAAFFLTALLIFASGKYMHGKRKVSSSHGLDALMLGLAQGIATIPGLSRSGATISTLLLRGFSRESAFRYSFLASIPAIIGALLFEARAYDFVLSLNMCLGVLAAFLSGLLGLHILITLLKKMKWYVFGYYCVAIGALSYLLAKI